MPIFHQNGQRLIFLPKFGEIVKLPNYVKYFGSNIVEGVAESLVEAEMSWVELDGAVWNWVEMDEAGWRWTHGLVIKEFLKTNLMVMKLEIFMKKKYQRWTLIILV